MATAHAKHHDYHLVDPSPWPVVGSISAFVMAVGAHHLDAAHVRRAPRSSSAPAPIGVLYTMASWWGDVIREAQYKGDHTRVVQIGHALRHDPVHRLRGDVLRRLVLGLLQFRAVPADAVHATRDAVFGCGPGTAMGACSVPGTWPPKGIETFDPWHLPLLNTLLLLTSGTTVTWAHHALLEGDRKGAQIRPDPHRHPGRAVHLRAGLRVRPSSTFSSPATGLYGATFFMATGFHGFHVLVGTVFLLVCLFRAYAGHFTPTQHLGFEFAAWYWHFVDVVWLFLFVCIYVWFRGAGPVAGH